MNHQQIFAIVFSIVVLAADFSQAVVPDPIVGAKIFHHSAKKGIAVPLIVGKKALLAGKKALLLAPIAVPLALGAKAGLVATGAVALAVPAAIGAAVGAPLGAIIGAKAGAIKGAAVGKAILGAKLLVGAKLAAAGVALAAKPVVLVIGAKAKAAALGVHFLGKGVGLAGTGVLAAGKGISFVGSKLNDVSLKVKGLGADVADNLRMQMESMSPKSFFPVDQIQNSISALPAIDPLTLLQLLKGPKSLESKITLNTPLTGEKVTKAVLSQSRRRRSAAPEPQGAHGARRTPPHQSDHRSQLTKLMSYVQEHKLQGCLARVVCELSANPNTYGAEGIRFGSSLLTMSRVEHASTTQYRSASTVGTQSRNPKVCQQRFSSCHMPSEQVIKIGNKMLAPSH